MSAAPKLILPQPVQTEVTQITSPVDTNIVGMVDKITPDEVLRYAADFKLNHIVQRQGHDFAHELKTAKAMIEAPENYFKFPISSILSPHDVGPIAEARDLRLDFAFDYSGGKKPALDSITQILVSEKISQTAIIDVISVADEMFTNAIYNAPFSDHISLKNPGVSRHDIEIKLEGEQKCRMLLALNKDCVVVGCEDPFGSLNLERYFHKIRNTYLRGPAATMNFGPGGAGIGSYIIFNAGSSLYMGVRPTKATVLCCVIPIGIAYRKRAQMPKHLHWIQL